MANLTVYFAHKKVNTGEPFTIQNLIRLHSQLLNIFYRFLKIEAALAYPVFVKPANGGSSVGISKARDKEELAQ